ncbi:uncharacterized protein TNCV_2219681 [Trichonephila clavipes]|nr:uncharacterized protein TNCV_2219681 [Trichonephila clavipes]
MNLTLSTSSKYSELNGQVTLSEWMKTAPLKEGFNAQPISTRRKGMSNLRWIDGLDKDLLVLRTRNWRTLRGRRMAWKRLLEEAKVNPGLSCYGGRNSLSSGLTYTTPPRFAGRGRGSKDSRRHKA